jgi:predicted nucleic acid-binding protein
MGTEFLIDTNILIYYFDGKMQPEVKQRTEDIFEESFKISVISKIEFLGWPDFSDQASTKANEFIANANILTLTEEIVNKTISIKRKKKIKLADAVIAATCLISNLTLVTRNEKDFEGIEGLTIYNPFKGSLDIKCDNTSPPENQKSNTSKISQESNEI